MKDSFDIRPAKEDDIPKIMQIYDLARKWMRNCGNTDQWDESYPNEQIVRRDILNGNLYKAVSEDEICGVFALIFGEDPTYKVIEDGSWHADKPYATIHRIASSGRKRGVAAACFNYALKRADYLRVDTHEKNTAMQKAVSDYGFKKCGRIFIADGSQRIAYDYIAFYMENAHAAAASQKCK